MPEPDFNMRQWAKDHDRRDDERFKAMSQGQTSIWRVLAFVGMTFVALTGWSLKNQYESMAKNETHAQEQLNAIYAVSGQVSTVQATAVPNRPK